MFDWLTQVQASPLTYLAVLGACALDAVLLIVPSEAVVIAASILATGGELSIWLVALAAAGGGFLGDWGSYLLGRTAGASAARRLFRSPKAKRRLSWVGEALDRHGATIIVVAALALLIVLVVDATGRLRWRGARAGGRGAVGGWSER